MFLSAQRKKYGQDYKHGGFMPTTNEKMEFAYLIAKHSTITLYQCKRIMRFASTHQRLAVTACNRELTEKEIRKQETVMMDIIEMCADADVKPLFGGDPRGCTVKLQVPDGYTNDMGQEGICVPA
jgi:hypothetical protein